ncbi:MAG: rod shape-determining protein RodA, partial [Marinirhabdus sp.]
MAKSRSLQKFDRLTIFIYLALVAMGWVNIYSASLDDTSSFFQFSHVYFKQLIWMGLSVLLILFILTLDTKFYERFSSIIYLVAIVLLLGLFLFGKNVNGATSWYALGSVSVQPSEFAKVATALALAKYLSGIQTNLNEFKHQLRSFLIIAVPAL